MQNSRVLTSLPPFFQPFPSGHVSRTLQRSPQPRCIPFSPGGAGLSIRQRRRSGGALWRRRRRPGGPRPDPVSPTTASRQRGGVAACEPCAGRVSVASAGARREPCWGWGLPLPAGKVIWGGPRGLARHPPRCDGGWRGRRACGTVAAAEHRRGSSVPPGLPGQSPRRAPGRRPGAAAASQRRPSLAGRRSRAASGPRPSRRRAGRLQFRAAAGARCAAALCQPGLLVARLLGRRAVSGAAARVVWGVASLCAGGLPPVSPPRATAERRTGAAAAVRAAPGQSGCGHRRRRRCSQRCAFGLPLGAAAQGWGL